MQHENNVFAGIDKLCKTEMAISVKLANPVPLYHRIGQFYRIDQFDIEMVIFSYWFFVGKEHQNQQSCTKLAKTHLNIVELG